MPDQKCNVRRELAPPRETSAEGHACEPTCRSTRYGRQVSDPFGRAAANPPDYMKVLGDEHYPSPCSVLAGLDFICSVSVD